MNEWGVKTPRCCVGDLVDVSENVVHQLGELLSCQLVLVFGQPTHVLGG